MIRETMQRQAPRVETPRTALPLSDSVVIGLRWFRADRPAFDEYLRDHTVPLYRRLPGLTHLCLARQGPDEAGRRVLVTLWSSAEAEHQGALEVAGAPASEDAVDDAPLAAPLALLAIGSPAGIRTGILRIARGVLRDGDVARYIGQVEAGLHEDHVGGVGPAWLALALLGRHRFLTVSAWAGWESIERVTGATIASPIRTKRSEQLARFEAEHFELLDA